MANREERERLRQERLAAQAGQGSAERRRLILGYVVAGVLAAAVLVGLVIVIASGGEDEGPGGDTPENAHINADFGGTFTGLEPDGREGAPPPEIQFGDLEESARKAGCEPRLDLPDEGNSHVPDSREVAYKTDPPTSGAHNAEWISDGAYLTPLNTDTSTSPNVRNFVHALEHGRVQIQYSPDLPEGDQLALKGVFDEDPGGILMFPNAEMPYEVAFMAWTNLVGCPSYDPLVLDVLRNFRDTFRGNGPEDFPF